MKENETKTQSKGMRVFKAVINTIINIMIVVVLITSILIAVLALTSRANGISTIFGYTVQTIESDSMKGGSPDGYPGGDFGNGDLMIAKATGGDLNAEYNLGDIVTYVTEDLTGQKAYIVHRIVKIADNAQGYKVYQTWGDNREISEVPDQMEEYEYLPGSAIVSVFHTANYDGKIIKGVGGFLNYLRSQQGFFLIVLLPMIIFFMYELVRVVMNMNSYRKAKADEEKEEAVKAALAENNAQAPEAQNLTPEQMEQFKAFLEQQKQNQNQDQAKIQDTDQDQTET